MAFAFNCLGPIPGVNTCFGDQWLRRTWKWCGPCRWPVALPTLHHWSLWQKKAKVKEEQAGLEEPFAKEAKAKEEPDALVVEEKKSKAKEEQAGPCLLATAAVVAARQYVPPPPAGPGVGRSPMPIGLPTRPVPRHLLLSWAISLREYRDFRNSTDPADARRGHHRFRDVLRSIEGYGTS